VGVQQQGDLDGSHIMTRHRSPMWLGLSECVCVHPHRLLVQVFHEPLDAVAFCLQVCWNT
jgi:hypothetical protein